MAAAAARSHTAVALCIDSQDFPYRSLTVRGRLDDVSEQPGLVPEYREATVRYLGPDTALRWFDHLGAGWCAWPCCRRL